MIQTIDLRSRDLDRSALEAALPRAVVDIDAAVESAEELVHAVRTDGAAALYDQAERLDGVRQPTIRVPQSEIDGALARLDPAVRTALESEIGRVRRATSAQVPPERITAFGEGATVVQRWQPVDRVGVYVPGGKAAYASSVVMNVVPAQVAGVGSVALASPPQKRFGGRVHPTILAAAALLEVEEVYAMGGAGAIGAFAYGVESIGLDPVDVVTGPGNAFVAAAKRLVRGRVGIDSEAGATEILIIADGWADARRVAADLVSQAEHDEQAASVLVTDSPALAAAVERELAIQTESTRHSGRVASALSGAQSAIVLVDDPVEATRVSNAYAPEHLEVLTKDPRSTLQHITSAGAIFLGEGSPVSLGDYMAGSNHVLPTGGGARYASGLGAHTFLRAQQIIEYADEALRRVAPEIAALSEAEDLPAHGDAVSIRFEA